MTFRALGFNFDLLAIVVFLFGTLVIEELLKPLLKPILKTNLSKVILSWIIGAGVFMVITAVAKDFVITIACIVQFAAWVLLLNGAYKYLKPPIKRLRSLLWPK